MASLGRSHPLSHQHHTHGSAMPATKPIQAPEPAPIAAGSKPHFIYKCLLNEHAQKMRKLPPNYQTQNEGSDHLPKFRSTVTFDGVSYTSSNTFPNLKMAEMDVSKIAYAAMIQKSQSEALRHIQEDKSICKSIMIEYSVKMNLERPAYVTSHQGGAIPVFRSHMSFNGATFLGDNAKSKKEAEQLVARVAIFKYLDSEFVNDMAEVVNCKFRHAAEISKFQEIKNAYTRPCVPEVPTGPTTPATPVVTQACIAKVLTEPTRLAFPVVTQPRMIEPITPAAPVVTQPRIAEVVAESLTPAAPVVTQPRIAEVVAESLTPAAPVVTQPRTAKVMAESLNPAAPVVTQPQIAVVTESLTPAAPVVTQPLTPKVQSKPITLAAPVVTHPLIPKTEQITSTAPVVTQPRIPKIEPITPPTAIAVTHPRIPKFSTESVSKTVPVVTQPHQEGIRPAICRPPVLAPTPSAQHKPLTAVRRPVVFAQTPSGQLASNSLDHFVEHKPLTLQTPGRKRYWEESKNAQKKMRVDTQRPVPVRHASPAQPFQSQCSRSKENNIRMPHKNASWH